MKKNKILIFWFLSIVFGLILVISCINPFKIQLQRAYVQREIMKLDLILPNLELNTPFLCNRTPIMDSNTLYKLEHLSTILGNEPNVYRLQIVLNCLLNDLDDASLFLEMDQNEFVFYQQIGIFGVKGNLYDNLDYILNNKLSNKELLHAADIVIKNHLLEDSTFLITEISKKSGESKQLANLWLQIGKDFEEKKEWNKALAWYQSGLDLQEGWIDKSFRGSLCLRIGRIYQVYLDPQDIQIALVYYDQALGNVDQLTSWEQNNAYQYRGEIYRILPDEFGPYSALNEFKRAIEIEPDSYGAYLSIGFVYFYDFKDYDHAEEFFLMALDINPDNKYAYFYLGDLYIALANYEKAAWYYQQASERDPDWQAPKDRLAALVAGD